MKKVKALCFIVGVALSAFADGEVKMPEPDWDGICLAITNECVRCRHPDDAWMAIAATKIRYQLTSEQILEVFKRCMDGLGDSPVGERVCERIVHCMGSECGTNALPYVEYLIENDRRDGVVSCAYRQLVKMETDLDRQLLSAEKILAPESGRDDCSRIVVYQELCDIWARIERDGSPSDKVTMRDFFMKRRLMDERFNYRAPQDFRPQRKDDAIEWERVCYVISNTFVNAKPPRDGYLTLVHVRNSYNLAGDVYGVGRSVVTNATTNEVSYPYELKMVPVGFWLHGNRTPQSQ